MEAIARIEKENRLIAAGGTILFATLVLLLFLFVKILSPIPPFEEGGGVIEVALGMDDFGMGNDIAPPPAVNTNQNQAESENKNPSSSQTEMLTSTNAENISVPLVNNKQSDVKVEDPQPDPNLMKMSNKLSNHTGTGTGHGETDIPGWQGDENGDPNSHNYSPFKGPAGIEGKINGGRKMIGGIDIYDDSQESGTVAVEIIVDKSGKIVKAEPVLIGSTTTSSLLWKKAKEGLLNKVLFTPSQFGESSGTIKINFTVR